jgi:hypothetical protein
MDIQITISLGEYNPPKSEKKVDPVDETAAELDMRLMARDKLTDAQQDKLNADVLAFATEMVEKKQYEKLRSFLEKATHHLTEDLRDMLAEMLGGLK